MKNKHFVIGFILCAAISILYGVVDCRLNPKLNAEDACNCSMRAAVPLNYIAYYHAKWPASAQKEGNQ